MGDAVLTLAGAGFCYLIGSIPFSYLIARQVKGVDLRVAGEGNVGARNVWHVVGKRYGALAALLDFSKGLIAWGVGRGLSLESPVIWALGYAAVLGHAFPLFLRGRGGKGAATAMGFIFALAPFSLIIAAGVMLLAFLLFRDFHYAVAPGIALVPLIWRWPLQKPWVDIVLLLGLLLFLGMKRLIDEPYMKRIKARTGWDKS